MTLPKGYKKSNNPPTKSSKENGKKVGKAVIIGAAGVLGILVALAIIYTPHPSTSQQATIYQNPQQTSSLQGQLASSSIPTSTGAGHLVATISPSVDPITRGGYESVTVTVTDSSGHAIQGANVQGNIDYASGGTSKQFTGITDSSGKVSYTWKIGTRSTPGLFTMSTTVSAPGYGQTTTSGSFEVVRKN